MYIFSKSTIFIVSVFIMLVASQFGDDDEFEFSKQNPMELVKEDTDFPMPYHRDMQEQIQLPRAHEHHHEENAEKPLLRIKNPVISLFENPADVSNKYKGGNITDTLNFPYITSVIVNGRLWCSGTIVDDNWVLTAAHCLNYVLNVSPLRTLGKFVKVRVGSVHSHEGGTLTDVVGAVRHPKFEEEPVPHADVALLKTSRKLCFSKYINLLKIYEGNAEPYAQSFITIAGWGATRGSEVAYLDKTPDLMQARLKVRPQQYCIDSYQTVNNFMFTEDFFCASLRAGVRDACLFDAGAPAVQQNRLMGIMSFGPEKCGGTKPAVFIKAFYFRDFVKHTIASYKTPRDLIDAIQEVGGLN